MEKTCNTCKETKPVEKFYEKRDRKNKFQGVSQWSSECRECVLKRHKTDRVKSQRAELRKLGGARNSELKREYGITLEDYHSMLASQGVACLICGRMDSGHKGRLAFCVDHDHKTGRVRGLLCQRCNHAIGLFNDNPDICMSAAEYLKSGLPEFDVSRELDVTYC